MIRSTYIISIIAFLFIFISCDESTQEQIEEQVDIHTNLVLGKWYVESWEIGGKDSLYVQTGEVLPVSAKTLRSMTAY